MALTVGKDMRTMAEPLPTHSGTLDGLALAEWVPDSPRAGVVIIHGARSSKESHHDFARACHAAGLAALCFDQRGCGDSPGPMDGRMIADVVAMADCLRETTGRPDLPIALRGSSLGGYLAIAAAGRARAETVIAICPASASSLRRVLANGWLADSADAPAVAALLDAHDLGDIVGALPVPLLLMHAEGDEVVPVAHSRALAALAAHPRSRLIVVPGGHHRSIQHDGDLQAVTLRFLRDALAA
jgi:alpha-beta hydrolase superfamily lysophospholipase